MADVRLRDLNPAEFNYSVNIAGSLGVGTTSPDVKLHVYDSTINSLDLLHLETAADSVDDYIGIKFTSNVGGSGPHAAIRAYGGPASGDTYISLLTTSDGGTLTQGLTQVHNGNVGIGTTSPASTVNLHISDANPKLRLQDSDETNVYTEIFNSSGDTHIRSRDGSSNGIFSLIGNNGTTDQYFLRIDADGDVGIGTDSPANLLHVLGNGANGEIKTERASGAVSLIQAQASLVRFGATSNHNLQFFTNDTARVTITNAGLIGIGTTSPTADLTVGDGTSSESISINKSTSGTATLNFLNAGSAKVYFQADADEHLRIATNNSVKMSILENGNVGIGETSPTETLHVNGNVKITGSIDVGSSGFDVSSGFILPFGGGTAPSGWLECNGQVVSRSTYSALFAIIGTIYGAGDGSTTFAVPDLQGRVIVGQGGNTALRTPTDLEDVGDTFGSQTHTLTEDEMPKHRHQSDFFIANVNHPRVRIHHGGVSKYGQPFTTFAGGDQAHNNIQPSIVINYLIKT